MYKPMWVKHTPNFPEADAILGNNPGLLTYDNDMQMSRDTWLTENKTRWKAKFNPFCRPTLV